MENFRASLAPVPDSEEQDGRGYDGGMGGRGVRGRAKDKERKAAEGRTAARRVTNSLLIAVYRPFLVPPGAPPATLFPIFSSLLIPLLPFAGKFVTFA